MTCVLPPFFCPFPSVLHPEVDALERSALEWLTATGLAPGEWQRKALAGTRSAEFLGRIVPDADPGRMQPFVNWCYWGFAVDDDICETGAGASGAATFVIAASHLQLRLLTRERTGEVYGDALADIAGSVRELATPTQYRRWVQAHQYWLAGVAWQAANQERAVLAGLADYLPMRLRACAGEVTTGPMEIVRGTEIPSAELDSPRVLAMTQTAQLVAALDNDVVSYGKEAVEGPPAQNLVTVMQRRQGGSLQDALIEAVAVRDRVMSLFLRLRERVRADGSEPLRIYADDLARTIRGNAEWSLTVPRYQLPTGEAVRSPGWTDRPSDGTSEPLPVPSFAWWWDQV